MDPTTVTDILACYMTGGGGLALRIAGSQACLGSSLYWGHFSSAKALASLTSSSTKLSSRLDPLMSFVAVTKKAQLTSGRLLRNRSAAISANVTPPRNITRTTLRFLGAAPEKTTSIKAAHEHSKA